MTVSTELHVSVSTHAPVRARLVAVKHYKPGTSFNSRAREGATDTT